VPSGLCFLLNSPSRGVPLHWYMRRVHSPQSRTFALQSPPRLHLGMTTPSTSTVLLSLPAVKQNVCWGRSFFGNCRDLRAHQFTQVSGIMTR
jgi:hypothetical protein